MAWQGTDILASSFVFIEREDEENKEKQRKKKRIL